MSGGSLDYICFKVNDAARRAIHDNENTGYRASFWSPGDELEAGNRRTNQRRQSDRGCG